MIDTAHTLEAPSVDARIEAVEVTPSLVAETVMFDGSEVPPEMLSAVERVWADRDFTWPTTIAVTSLRVREEDGTEGAPVSVSHIGVLGTGFEPGQPVHLSWANTGAADVPLPDVMADERGFLGAEIVSPTLARRNADYQPGGATQLSLVATQGDGDTARSASQQPLPLHALFHWTR